MTDSNNWKHLLLAILVAPHLEFSGNEHEPATVQADRYKRNKKLLEDAEKLVKDIRPL